MEWEAGAAPFWLPHEATWKGDIPVVSVDATPGEPGAWDAIAAISTTRGSNPLLRDLDWELILAWILPRDVQRAGAAVRPPNPEELWAALESGGVLGDLRAREKAAEAGNWVVDLAGTALLVANGSVNRRARWVSIGLSGYAPEVYQGLFASKKVTGEAAHAACWVWLIQGRLELLRRLVMATFQHYQSGL